MKECSQVLKNYLHSRKVYHMCDLYEFNLMSGMTLRYADYDIDITLNDKAYLANGPIFRRDRVSLKLGIQVDSMNITVTADETDTIGTKTFMQAAHIGAFDDGTMSLNRCFMSEPGAVVDILEMFTGEIEIKSAGGLELALEVKSSVQRLNVEYPLRSYYVECPFSVYDANCGLDINNFKKAGTVQPGSTAAVIKTNLTFAKSYYDNGGILFTGGTLKGVTMPIKTSESGVLRLMLECVATPAAGDAFTLYPGCDKSNAMCKERFANSLHNRSTPYIPLPEAVI